MNDESGEVRRDLSQRMVASFLGHLDQELELKELIRSLLGRLERAAPHARLFACGGSVRDLAVAGATGVETRLKDVDLVVEGVGGTQLGGLLKRLGADLAAIAWVELVGISFPVWKVKVRGVPDPVDVALVRTERSFGSGRVEPVVTPDGVTVEDDSLHRDFTMNAMYIELRTANGNGLDGELLDFHDGLRSVIEREICTVGTAEHRFREDPLRMLRAVRFEASLTGFEIEPATAEAIRRLAPELVGAIATDRLADELDGALRADPGLALEELAELGILDALIPELGDLGRGGRSRAALRIAGVCASLEWPPAPSVLFAALLLDLAFEEALGESAQLPGDVHVDHRSLTGTAVNDVARRLRLPNVRKITRLCSGVLVLTSYAVLESANAVAEEVLSHSSDTSELLSLYQASQQVLVSDAVDFADLVDSFPPSTLDFGRLVDVAGIDPGPHLHGLKLALRQAEIEGEVAGEDDAMRFVAEWKEGTQTLNVER